MNRGKVIADYKTADLYKFYKKTYKNPVDYKTFKEFYRDFFTEILNLMIYNGIDYILPGRLGSMRIKKKKNMQKIDENGELKTNFRADWKASKELWKKQYPDKTLQEIFGIPNKQIVYHMNEHTDNYYFKWYWDKITCNIPNKSAYRFEPIRAKKREAAKAWKEISNLQNIYYE